MDIRYNIIEITNKKKREEYKQELDEIVKSKKEDTPIKEIKKEVPVKIETYKYVFPTEEYAEISKEYIPNETYKYVFPIEEYVTISKKYNDKRKVKIPKFKVTKNNIHEEEFKTRSNVTGDEDEIKKGIKDEQDNVKDYRQKIEILM